MLPRAPHPLVILELQVSQMEMKMNRISTINILGESITTLITSEVMVVQINGKFKMLTITNYSEIGDPLDHLEVFKY